MVSINQLAISKIGKGWEGWYSFFTTSQTQNRVHVEKWLKADAHLLLQCHDKNKQIGSCENNSLVSKCCWITTCCKYKQTNSNDVAWTVTQAIQLYWCCMHELKDWQFNHTRVHELVQRLDCIERALVNKSSIGKMSHEQFIQFNCNSAAWTYTIDKFDCKKVWELDW